MRHRLISGTCTCNNIAMNACQQPTWLTGLKNKAVDAAVCADDILHISVPCATSQIYMFITNTNIVINKHSHKIHLKLLKSWSIFFCSNDNHCTCTDPCSPDLQPKKQNQKCVQITRKIKNGPDESSSIDKYVMFFVLKNTKYATDAKNLKKYNIRRQSWWYKWGVW